jgi:hypothetical protein
MTHALRWLGVAAVAAVIVAAGGSAEPAAAAGPLYVAPSGTGSAPCTKTSPCFPLQAAFQRAAPGQVVDLLSGAYPAMALGPVAKTSSQHVVFTPAPGAKVAFTGRLTIDGAAHLTLSHLDLWRPGYDDRSLFFQSCSSDVTMDAVSGETFFIMEGVRSLTFKGGSWGGYGQPGHEDSAIGTSGAYGPANTCGGALAAPAGPILIDGVTFHDVFWNVPESGWGGSHPDCFEVNGYVDGLTIRNSRFLRCASTFMQINGDQGDMANMTFRNNVYSQLGGETWYGIQITSDGKPGKCGNVVFSHNTYAPDNPTASTWPNGPIRTDCEAIPGTAPVTVSANYFMRSPPDNECARYLGAPYSVNWRSNMFADGACGQGSRGVPFGYTAGPTGLLRNVDAATVRFLYRLAGTRRATHMSVARALAKARLHPPSGRWTAAAIDAIVADEVYTGGLVGAKGADPALVTPPMWRAAQQILRR